MNLRNRSNCNNLTYEEAFAAKVQTGKLYRDSTLAHNTCRCGYCFRPTTLKTKRIKEEEVGDLFDSLETITKALYSNIGRVIVARDKGVHSLLVDLVTDTLSIVVYDNQAGLVVDAMTVSVKAFIRGSLPELKSIEPFLNPKNKVENPTPPTSSIFEVHGAEIGPGDLVGNWKTPNNLWNKLIINPSPAEYSLTVGDEILTFSRLDQVIVHVIYPVIIKDRVQVFGLDKSEQERFMDYCNELAASFKPKGSPVIFDSEQAAKALERGCYVNCIIKTNHGEKETVAYIDHGKVFVDEAEFANISNAVGFLTDFCASGFLLSVRHGAPLNQL